MKQAANLPYSEGKSTASSVGSFSGCFWWPVLFLEWIFSSRNAKPRTILQRVSKLLRLGERFSDSWLKVKRMEPCYRGNQYILKSCSKSFYCKNWRFESRELPTPKLKMADCHQLSSHEWQLYTPYDFCVVPWLLTSCPLCPCPCTESHSPPKMELQMPSTR